MLFQSIKHSIKRLPGNRELIRIHLLLLSFFVTSYQAMGESLHIFPQSYYSVNEGLSHNDVTTIFQDSKGYIWFGTKEGINRFDGYDFIVYKTSTSDVSSNHITTIFEDSNRDMWIGTQDGGINRFQPENDTFIPYMYADDDTVSISNNHVLSICETGEGLWIGTWAGLNLLDPNTGTIKRVHSRTWKTTLLPWTRITVLHKGNDGDVWIGTEKTGIYRYIKETKSIEKVNISQISQSIRDINEHPNGDIWILTDNEIVVYRSFLDQYTIEYALGYHNSNELIFSADGAVCISTGHGKLEQIITKTERSIINLYSHNGLESKRTQSLYKDRDENLWIGTTDGVYKIFPDNGLYSLPLKTSMSQFPNVTALYSDREDRLWVGRENGLSIITQGGDIEKNYRSLETIFQSKYVTAIQGDPNGNYWIGTKNNGIYRIEKDDFSSIHFLHNTSKNSIPSNTINDLCIDDNGYIWFATESGLCRIPYGDVQPLTVDRFFTETGFRSFENKNAFTSIMIHPSNDGSIIVGTKDAGIIRFTSPNQIMQYYRYNRHDPFTLSDNSIVTLYTDDKNRIWVGTKNGLNVIAKGGAEIKRYFESDGLPNNHIIDLLEDEKNQLWITTQSGLALYDEKTDHFTPFTKDDGLGSHQFNSGAVAMNHKGELLLGGKTGIAKIATRSIHPPKMKYKPSISAVRVNNKSLDMELNEDETSQEEKVIELSHTDRVITFDFAAMFFTRQNDIQYAYRLENFDDDWILTDPGNRRANYTNLEPGNYTFVIKASLSGKDWSNPHASIDVRVKPAPWKTIPAYLLYVSIVIGLLVYLRQYEIRQLSLSNDLQKERFQREKLLELDQTRAKLYEDISHEFRTPLTLIKGRIEEIKQQLDPQDQKALAKQFDASVNNTNRLERLVLQLMNLSRLETGAISLNKSDAEFKSIIRRSADLYQYQCMEKGISLEIELPESKLDATFDTQKISQVLDILISNAMNFTSHGGTITVSTYRDSQFIRCNVSDTGPGIPEDALPRVFERFYRGEHESVQSNTGIGIGLALAKEIIELHNGTIHAENRSEVGARFSFAIPAMADSKKNVTVVKSDSNPPKDHPDKIAPKKLKGVMGEKPRVLVAEDNMDMADYISDLLENHFSVYVTSNGKEGYEKAVDIKPDVIISDVMMPELDGLGFLKKVRSDSILGNTPFILLTARADVEHQIEGLQQKADLYLTKPFDSDELKVQVQNLAERHGSLQLQSEELTLPQGQSDASFIQRAKEVVDANLSDSEFTSQQFAKSMYLSSRQLERKIKDITGLSPLQFVRQIRLEYAKNILIKGIVTSVSDAAMAVGYTQVKYFSKLFRDQYGHPPGKYIRKS